MTDTHLMEAVNSRLRSLYEQAAFAGDPGAVEEARKDLAYLEAYMELASGRLMHLAFLHDRQLRQQELDSFGKAAALFAELGDRRAEGEALFWLGVYYQAIGDDDAALPALSRALELATACDDKLTLSYILRHLAFTDEANGDTERALGRIQESLQLRREIGFDAGVAAGILGLAEFHGKYGDRELADQLFVDATTIATQSGSHAVLEWIARARTQSGRG